MHPTAKTADRKFVESSRKCLIGRDIINSANPHTRRRFTAAMRVHLKSLVVVSLEYALRQTLGAGPDDQGIFVSNS